MSFRKAVSTAVCILLAATLAACGSSTSGRNNTSTAAATQNSTAAADAGNEDGGWNINRNEVSMEMNEAVKTLFENAAGKLDGVDYEPIAYLADQVVAGTNYCILCRSVPVTKDAVTSFVLVYIYEDLSGNADVTHVTDLYTDSADNGTGGTEVNLGPYELNSNYEVKAAFQKAVAMTDGADFEAIAYLGSQVVSGTNYDVLSRVTAVSQDSEPVFAIVTIYEDLNGNATIQNIADLDIAALQEETADQIPNPYTQVSSLEEAAKITGFSVTVPDAPEDHPVRIIRVMNQEMIEVIYADRTDGTTEDNGEDYRIRKASGTEDISGDYNDYENTETRTIGDYEVALKGNDGNCSVAVWNYGGCSYAVDAQDSPLSLDAVTEIIRAVK